MVPNIQYILGTESAQSCDQVSEEDENRVKLRNMLVKDVLSSRVNDCLGKLFVLRVSFLFLFSSFGSCVSFAVCNCIIKHAWAKHKKSGLS